MGRTMGVGQLPAVDARVGAEGTRLELDGVCRWFGVGDTVVRSGKTTLLNLIGALDAPTAARSG